MITDHIMKRIRSIIERTIERHRKSFCKSFEKTTCDTLTYGGLGPLQEDYSTRSVSKALFEYQLERTLEC